MLLAVSVAFLAAQGPMLNQAIDRVLAEQPVRNGRLQRRAVDRPAVFGSVCAENAVGG